MPTRVLVVADESDLERLRVRHGADALAPVQSGGLVNEAGNFFVVNTLAGEIPLSL